MVLWLFLQYANHVGEVCILLCMMLRGVFDVLVEGALNLLRCLIYVVAPDVEVLDPLAYFMVASSRE